jgi:hypothetical protein
MSISQFNQFKAFLTAAMQDENFVSNNSLLQDSAVLQTYLDRIDALTDDVTLLQDYSDWESGLGLLLQDSPNRTISFEPKGFENTLSVYREGTISEPRRLFRRATTTDGVYYLLADGGIGATGTGVFLLNNELEVLRRFANYGTGATLYEDASAAITFTLSSVEYVAIADATHHVIQIYLYAAPYTHVATVGTFDTSGAATDLLTAPNGIAVDEANEVMYISCPTGQPAGATASNGFVAEYDISTIGTPAFTSIELYYSGTGSVLDGQVYTPVDLVFADSILWVSNAGANHVGAFDMSGSTPTVAKFIESSGPGYTLRTPGQIYFRSTLGTFGRLYVVNTATGTVEEFDSTTYQHLQTYGIRASEDNLGSYTRLSPDVYGALGQPQGVVVDSVSIGDQDTTVMVVTDPTNGRLQRFNLDAYTNDNFVNFDLQTFAVPIVFDSWSVSGNIPLDMVTVWYRYTLNEDFREMPQEASLSATRTIQFRIGVKLDTRKFIHADWNISRLRVHGRQA